MNRLLSSILVLVVLPGCGGCELEELNQTGEEDAGALPALDAGQAEEPDEDAGQVIEDDAGPTDECVDLATPGDANKKRVVLSGHSTQNYGGVELVHFLRAAVLDVNDGFLLDDATLDLPFAPHRIEFVPSGAFAVVLGDDGEVATVRVAGPGNLALIDQVSVAEAGASDLRLSADGSEAFITIYDVTEETAGLAVVQIGCTGQLTVMEDAFLGLRLSQSLALLPGEERAVLLGGQAVFEPIDDDDVRMLARDGAGFVETASYDIWGDFIDTLRIAVSPDGSTLVIPNGSPFSSEGNQVLVADIDDELITESHRLSNLEDPREALFSPDGQTVLVTLLSANRVKVLADEGAGLAVVSEVSGIGLAEQMAMIGRGALSGTVLVTSVDPSGTSNLARLQITGPGVVVDQGQLDLPDGVENIPRAVAVQP